MEIGEVRELVCIRCPIGCSLVAKMTESGVEVTGNTCKRGEEYAVAECVAPTRTVTTTVKVLDGEIARVPVKTAAPIPKDRIFAALYEIKTAEALAPVKEGATLIKNVAGTGVDVVATRTVEVD